MTRHPGRGLVVLLRASIGITLLAMGGGPALAQVSVSGIVRDSASGRPVCVFVNGLPRPGLTLDLIPIETIEVVELFGERDDAVRNNLLYKWPGRAQCGVAHRLARYQAPKNSARGKATAKYAVVWLKP